MSSENSQSFMGIASIPKLKGKSNCKEWRNGMQGFCEISGYWRYMLREIPKPISPPKKELTPTTKEAFETKLMQWLTITGSIRGAIRTTCSIDPMSHVGDTGLASKDVEEIRIVVSRHMIYRARLDLHYVVFARSQF